MWEKAVAGNKERKKKEVPRWPPREYRVPRLVEALSREWLFQFADGQAHPAAELLTGRDLRQQTSDRFIDTPTFHTSTNLEPGLSSTGDKTSQHIRHGSPPSPVPCTSNAPPGLGSRKSTCVETLSRLWFPLPVPCHRAPLSVAWRGAHVSTGIEIQTVSISLLHVDELPTYHDRDPITGSARLRLAWPGSRRSSRRHFPRLQTRHFEGPCGGREEGGGRG